MKKISKQGVPLKITAEWTDNDYWERIDPEYDDLKCVNVAGWLVRVNGKKFPRGHYADDDTLDWTYRYTPEQGKTKEGKQIAIERAITEGGF